ncbi:cation:proton antiporter, partial [Streptomyces shenzhenensis]
GVEPRIGPLATAYVLLLVILGPLTARWTEPLSRRLTRRPRRAVPDATAADPVEVARANG